MASKAEHLYGVIDDLLLSIKGSKNPLMGVFVCEDIATHISQTLNVDYSSALAATVTVVGDYGLNLTYSETQAMVDTLMTELQNVRSLPWLKRKSINL